MLRIIPTIILLIPIICVFILFLYENEDTDTPQPRVLNGDHFTTEWWRVKASYETKQQMVIKLNKLVKQGVLEKVSVGEFEIVRFIPTANYCEKDILTMLK